ncbi:transcription factor DUO1-like [Tasmannia lanceolata]|uniref:transcription factor DUO1-like n=1 Tax=Tasmannia lanceolata TaxID=3420 RepID=UPI00406446A7
MEGQREESVVMRKGPWTAEEDEILMDYVKKYGPRDWSSIRSKGMLPRTGKSCRLRWVNKLKPDLKTGCKFSSEEERIVIDLQAKFGNKWARIATYLPGRTDNDVKNFWSTRQKRLARILQTSQQPKSQKNHGKSPIFSEVTAFEEPRPTSVFFHGSSSKGQCSKPSSYMRNSDDIKMVQLPDLLSPNLLNFETNLSIIDKPCLDPPPQFPYAHPPFDLPPLPESQDVTAGFCDPSFLDIFSCRETLESINSPQFLINGPQFPIGLSYFELDTDRHGIKQEEDSIIMNPDSFFDDIPVDMFDNLEPLLSSSER